MTEVKCLAAFDADSGVKPFSYKLDENLADEDVQISITHCGLCHSDLHSIKNDWKNTQYPIVAGHEMVGNITHIGKKVENLKIGQRVGVGPVIASCGNCDECKHQEEHMCAKGLVGAYNSKDSNGKNTYGGFSTTKRVHNKFAIKIPDQISSEDAAPLFCAGITVYSPLRHFTKSGQRVGVVGIGGLGHLGIQFARALGCHVIAISSSENKRELAMKLGANEFCLPSDFPKYRRTIDFLLFCGAGGDVETIQYTRLLKVDGRLCLVGVQSNPLVVMPGLLNSKRLSICGSQIGSPQEVIEMLDLCVKHNIRAMVENMQMTELNTALHRLEQNDVKFRFVLKSNL